jgi:uncharacterized protein
MVGAVNQRNEKQLASEVRVARSLWSRFWGLMGRRALPEDHGVLLTPCTSVHTFFMRFPIDVIFLDRDGRVVKIIPALKPWRTALGGRGARSALELRAGVAETTGLEPGDLLRVPDR